LLVRRQGREVADKLDSLCVARIEMPLSDGWVRGTGQLLLLNKKVDRRASGFRFNGWGEEGGRYNHDDRVPERVSEALDEPFYPIDLVLEGGAVHTAGQGTLLTTEQYMPNLNRNPARRRPRSKQRCWIRSVRTK
jgi:agmatine deiminase